MRHITFEGRLLPGPFTKLVTCLNKIGWSISDPLQVQDHEQHEWHLVNVDEKTPHALLMDVVPTPCQPKTMCDLVGVDLTLTLSA